MASWFTRALDRITPWNRGGEVQRRKEREEEQQRQQQQSQPRPQAPQQYSASLDPKPTTNSQGETATQVRTRQIKNVFDGIEDNFSLGNKPNNALNVMRQEAKTEPKPGDVVQPLADKEYLGVDVTGQENKKILGWNAAALLPKRFEKRDQLSTDRKLITNKDKYVAQFDKMSPEYKRILVDSARQKAAQGDAAAQNTLYALEDTNRIQKGRSYDQNQGLLQRGADFASVPGRSIMRVATGIPQGIAGLYDLVTPGEGTNRATKFFNETAQNLDKSAQDADVSAAYTTVNVPTEIASYLIPGAGATKLSAKTPRLARLMEENVGRIASYIDKGGDAGAIQRFIADRIRSGYTLEEVLQDVAIDSKYVGENSARGNETTPESIATDVATGTAGKFLFGGAKRAFDTPNPTPDAPRPTGPLPRSTEPVSIPVGRDIPINQAPSLGEPINVRNLTPQGEFIREFPGDNTPRKTTPSQLLEERQAERSRNQDFGQPDERIEGVTPRQTEGPSITTKADIDAERAELDQALANGEINKTQHKKANEALDEILPEGDVPKGRKIEVKQADSIPVRDETNVPQNLPETPGRVRVTQATAPSNAKSQAIAESTPPVAPTKADAPTAPETKLPEPIEDKTNFLKGLFNNGVGDDLTRATRALKDLKKVRKSDLKQRRLRGQRLKQEALDAGKSYDEAQAAYWSTRTGALAKAGYEGRGFDMSSEEGKTLRSIIGEFKGADTDGASNLEKSFDRLFNYGSNKYNDVLQPSDVKNIRKFFNQMVPDANLGDGVEQAIRELSDEMLNEPGKMRKLLGLQRSLLFTADVGSMFRQSLAGGLSHPVNWGKSVKKGFEVMFSQKKYDDMIRGFETDKAANYMTDRLGVDLNMLKGGTEEQFRNADWAKKTPIVNKVVDASERFFNAQTNQLRYENAKMFIDKAGGTAKLEKIAQETEDADNFLRALGEVTNTNTGRGKIGKLGDSQASWLAEVFTSPRGLAARIQRMNPAYYKKLHKTNKAAFNEAIRSATIQSIVTASALGAAAQAGLYEDGKIKVGNTRYDITGGVATMINTVNEIRKSMAGENDSPFTDGTSEFIQWGTNQMTPAINTFLKGIGYTLDESGKWENKYGEEFTAINAALENFVPLSVSGTINDLKDGTSPLQTAVNTGLNTIGINNNTYQSSKDKDLASREETADAVNSRFGKLDEYGLTNKEFTKHLPDDVQELLSEDNDKQLSEDELDKIQSAMVKGVTEAGADTAYLERGEYDNHLAVLKLKRDMMAEDNTTEPSKLENMDVAIKRGEIYKENKIPYDDIEDYQGTSLTEWRDMGDPESEDYDPDMYEKLWQMDQMMTEAGVSYGKELDEGKYYAKKKGSGSGSGRGGRRSNKISTEFGKLDTSKFGPQVRQYESIDTQTGVVPRIKKERPNIRHSIKVGR